MGFLLLVALALATTVTIYLLANARKQAAKARAFGCKPVPAFLPWDFIGIQNAMYELRGMKTKRLSYAFMERKNLMSAREGRPCKTFRVKYPVCETWYMTFDPKNLQAVLATQFQDFQQPAPKVGALEALLGPGIVSSSLLSAHMSELMMGRSSLPTELIGSTLEPCYDHNSCVTR